MHFNQGISCLAEAQAADAKRILDRERQALRLAKQTATEHAASPRDHDAPLQVSQQSQESLLSTLALCSHHTDCSMMPQSHTSLLCRQCCMTTSNTQGHCQAVTDKNQDSCRLHAPDKNKPCQDKVSRSSQAAAQLTQHKANLISWAAMDCLHKLPQPDQPTGLMMPQTWHHSRLMTRIC